MPSADAGAHRVLVTTYQQLQQLCLGVGETEALGAWRRAHTHARWQGGTESSRPRDHEVAGSRRRVRGA